MTKPTESNAARQCVIEDPFRLSPDDSNRRRRSTAALDPAVLSHRRHLADGTRISLRAIAPTDRVALRDELFLKLGTVSLRNRFLCTKLDLTELELTRFCQIDFYRHVAIVAEAMIPGHRRLIGVGRMTRPNAEAVEAEIAITVQDDFQGLGLGRLLLIKLIACARLLGIDRLEGTMFAHNYRMVNLMHATYLPHETSLEEGILTISLDLRAYRASIRVDAAGENSPINPGDLA